jgi:hypothetical protein
LIAYYYDGAGHLRFAFVEQAAVNGTRRELRIYWAADSTLLYRDVRNLAGPGWAWGDVEPVWHPVEWIRSGCDEQPGR